MIVSAVRVTASRNRTRLTNAATTEPASQIAGFVLFSEGFTERRGDREVRNFWVRRSLLSLSCVLAPATRPGGAGGRAASFLLGLRAGGRARGRRRGGG